jgi:hypothetical protein
LIGPFLFRQSRHHRGYDWFRIDSRTMKRGKS